MTCAVLVIQQMRYCIILILLCYFSVCVNGYQKRKPIQKEEYYEEEYYYNECSLDCDKLVKYSPLEVKIGVYLTQITDVSPDSSTFQAVGYYWVIWPTW